jgi:hypothetical protein
MAADVDQQLYGSYGEQGFYSDAKTRMPLASQAVADNCLTEPTEGDANRL